VSHDPGGPSSAALALAEQLGLSFTVADVLCRRGFGADQRTERFLAPRLAELTPPAELAGFAPAVQRLAQAIRGDERIVVFGDYDCDGVTSVAVVTEVVRALGGRVVPLLANRFDGGYGLSDRAVERALCESPAVLVACDCGSTDQSRVARARARGVDVVIVDHHEVPEDPPRPNAFINPQQPSCGFPYKGLATCGLALLLAAGLRRELGADLDVRQWLDLVAIGTVADVAPLDGDNRVLVRAGLARLQQSARPGLRALLGRLKRGRSLAVTAELVAFQIAPRLNAPGRLGDPRVALELLLASDDVRALQSLDRVEQAVAERRAIQSRMLAEATAEIVKADYPLDGGLLLAGTDWHPGVVEIVAGRLAAQYGAPSIAIALEGETGRGSARAPAGFDLYEALSECRPHLVSFGGHRAAAGVEVRADQIDRLRGRWHEVCQRQRTAVGLAELRLLPEARLDARDDLAQVVADLERFEPCGQGNPAPLLLLAPVTVRSARAVKTHLKLELTWGARQLSGFAPDRAADAPEIDRREVALVGRVRRDHWRGGDAVEVLVEGWTPLSSG
jgi:single-stranded-DNA-specific exonuclease